VAFIGLEDPIGKVIRWNDEPYTVIGVVKDILIQSPYSPVRPAMWHLSDDAENVFLIKLNPMANVKDAMAKIEAVFKRINPAAPFSAQFVDEQFARKFGDERRLGTLSTFFAFLAIFISCLGLFALASFVAEQRSKEIGIRKVMGASVSNLWRMLTQDFVILVLISCLISTPIAWSLATDWLDNYEYRTHVSWWIFAASIGGAILITLLTVSYQAIKVSVMNPVKSLRTE
jgi:ABC-type antimicrobial peptide transport system permease subunit